MLMFNKFSESADLEACLLFDERSTKSLCSYIFLVATQAVQRLIQFRPLYHRKTSLFNFHLPGSAEEPPSFSDEETTQAHAMQQDTRHTAK